MVHRFGTQLLGRPLHLVQEVLGKKGNVVAAVVQCRDLNHNHAKAVVEVFAKSSGRDFNF